MPTIYEMVATYSRMVDGYGKMVAALLDAEIEAGNRVKQLPAVPSTGKDWLSEEARERPEPTDPYDEGRPENYLQGNLSRDELNWFANDNYFGAELASALWGTFASERLKNFLKSKRRKLTFTENNEVSREDLRRLRGMKSLRPGAFRLYGPKTHALLSALLDAMFEEEDGQ